MMADQATVLGNPPLFLFGLASIATVIAGSATILISGNGTLQATANVVAWLTAALFALVLRRFVNASRGNLAIIALTLLALAATLFGNGLDGVHRWIALGPVNANMAALLLPAAIVALCASNLHESVSLALWLSLLILLVTQPDASQATGLASAACVVAWQWRNPWRFVSSALFVALAAFAWFRPDPLEAIETVEGVLGLAWAVSPILAGGLVAALATTVMSFLLLPNAGSNRITGYALFAYAVAVCASAAIGNFPVPLAGFGISFPIGWWLAVGLVQRRLG